MNKDILDDQQKTALNSILETVSSPEQGLPEELFQFVSELTPLINVDLLVKNNNGEILLARRNDSCGTGWHIPGGIIRYKEQIETRIKKVAQNELHTIIDGNPRLISINEIILKQRYRGHFISLLYECKLPEDFVIDNKELNKNEQGYLRWFGSCPNNLVGGQKTIYANLWGR